MFRLVQNPDQAPHRFATSFSIPYLLNEPYAALGSKVGFIFGTAAVLAGIFAYFCVPECNHRTLEEIDQLFLDGVPIRQFSKIRSVQVGEHGGRTNLEDGKNDSFKVVQSSKATNDE